MTLATCVVRTAADAPIVVNVDFCRISLRGKKLPPGADDFTSFLQGYIARWAGGIL
jgi:hypothetical protein